MYNISQLEINVTCIHNLQHYKAKRQLDFRAVLLLLFFSNVGLSGLSDKFSTTAKQKIASD